MSNEFKPIPISAAKAIADEYGYDQVVIVARKVGEGGGEHCTTYGVDKENCSVAARIGDFFKHELMRWPRPACICTRIPGNDWHLEKCPQHKDKR